MAGLMILGGAMQGYGNAALEQAKRDALAQKQAAIEQLRFERDRQMAAESRQFQAGENEKNRAADETRFNRTMDMQTRQLDLKERESGDLLQTPEGAVRVRGNTYEPVMDKDGNRLKTISGEKDRPADVATMEYLIANGVARDHTDAWRQIKQGVKADVQPADVERMVEAATKTEIDGKFGVSREEIQKIRNENRARIELNLGISKENKESSKPESSYPEAKRGGTFETGKIYNTPKGPLRYAGDGQWEKP